MSTKSLGYGVGTPTTKWCSHCRSANHKKCRGVRFGGFDDPGKRPCECPCPKTESPTMVGHLSCRPTARRRISSILSSVQGLIAMKQDDCPALVAITLDKLKAIQTAADEFRRELNRGNSK